MQRREWIQAMAVAGMQVQEGGRGDTPYPVTDHCDGTRFFNPGVDVDHSFGEILRWRLSGGGTPWPDRVNDPPQPLPPERVEAGAVACTMVGHATLLVQLGGMRLLTDPMFSERAGPFGLLGPKRVRPPAFSVTQLGRLDAVLLSHNHYDHCDTPSLDRIGSTGVPTIAPLGLGPLLREAGVSWGVEADWWETVTLLNGAHVTLIPAQHWSGRTLTDRRESLWCGFVVEHGPHVACVAGDTGFSERNFRAVAARWPRIDLALLPIGAYLPRSIMEPNHMNPEEAVRAHLILGATRSVAMHYGTFQLSDEGVDAPTSDLALARERLGVATDEFVVLAHGETRTW